MDEQNKKMELLGSAPIPKALLAMGLPTMIGMMINALYNLVDAYFVRGLGTSQMGAISVALPLGQAVVGLGLLFGNGAASYISRLLGHGDRKTANKVASTALYGSLLVGAVFGLVMALFPALITSQFTKDDLEMIDIGRKALRANGISFLFFGFYTVYSSLFLVLGKAKEGFILGACRQGICFVPIILILPMVWGLGGILYAQPVSDVASAVITAFMAVHLHRELAVA